jgi:DMSO/TMAO reductase YedYZ molybdopterin-dependent catalytic subunit
MTAVRRGEAGRSRSFLGALFGVLCAATAVGVGELVAAFVRPAAAPVIAVGNRIITLTPESAKQSGIRAAGTNDKLYLLIGIYLLLALFGALVGIAALNRLGYGLAGVAAFGVFGTYCALTAPAGRATDVIPTIVATAAAMTVLVLLVRAAGGSSDEPDPPAPDRRAVLQAGVATAAFAAVAGFGGRATQHARYDVSAARSKVRLPPPRGGARTVPVGADLGVSGVPWATTDDAFYRVDTALTLPQIVPDTWRLRIHGMVDRELTLTYDDVLARPLIERWITLCCVSNTVGGDLVGNARFRGVRLADLLREAGLHPASDQLLMTSVDGMTIGTPARVVMDGRDALLAVGMNGRPLPIEHGFPARTVVPGLYGYVSACKWIVDLEATTFARDHAYWVQEGWDVHPPIQLASRIDRPRSNRTVAVGESTMIAGVAWDQHVGVSTVEVEVDDGPWQAARLATVPSTDTWRQWLLPWTPPTPGTYRLRVRAIDVKGNVQPSQHRDPFPAGAAGWHTVTVHASR